MYEKGLALDILKQLSTAIDILLERFKPIKCVLDYTESPEGMEKLDAVCMLLIAIGEHQIKPLSDTIKKIIEDLI